MLTGAIDDIVDPAPNVSVGGPVDDAAGPPPSMNTTGLSSSAFRGDGEALRRAGASRALGAADDPHGHGEVPGVPPPSPKRSEGGME